MLVGMCDLAMIHVEEHLSSVDDFLEYADSLVPEDFRHHQAIIDNQRYVCCLVLRKNKLVPWDIKKPIIKEVMQDIKVTGYVDSLIEVTSLFGYSDRNTILKYGGKGE